LIKFGKILILRFSSLGDIILTFPLISVLRRKYPSVEIHFATNEKYIPLLKMNPQINGFLTYKGEPLKTFRRKIKENKYDLIIDLHKNYKSIYSTHFTNSKVLRYEKDNFKKFLLVSFKINLTDVVTPVYKKYMLTLHDCLDEIDYRFMPTELDFDRRRIVKPEYIVIAPSSKHFTKTFPKEKFEELIKNIKHHKIVLVGEKTKKDMSICRYLSSTSENIINYCGKVNYQALANVLYYSDVVICNDSGILHLSEALRKKVVAIFGSTVKEFGFYPQLEDSRVLEVKNLICRPCTHIGRYKCPLKHFKCMNEINISDFSKL